MNNSSEANSVAHLIWHQEQETETIIPAHEWLRILHQAEGLVLKMPELGINADSLALYPIEHLVGLLAFLKRLYAEKQAS